MESTRIHQYQLPGDSTSQSLIDAMADGDEEAWSRIAAVWGPALLRYFRRRDLQTSDAEEVVQNVLVRMFQGICGGRFERDGESRRLKYWVYTIAENEMASFCTRYRNRPQSPGGSEHQLALANLSEPGDCATLEALAVAQVLDVIKVDFQPATWQAFLLRYYENMTFQQIAEQLAIGEQAARQGVHRIRLRLKEELLSQRLLPDSPTTQV
ncbi:MAG: sigma-70 family RNA polymerase sigma factor, partial [Planctomycetaceae bacterium]|nr:sigma-70 family RNA polymerase sigma factor [Planctomycetaceae bacterium]